MTTFWIIYTSIMLVTALILRLNGHTLIGWELYILMGVLFPLQYRSRIQYMDKKIRIGSFVVFIIFNLLFLYLSAPSA